MLTPIEKQKILRSWRLVMPIADTAADLFYRRLFELRPEYRELFPDDMERQKRKLISMLAFVVKALDWGVDEWAEEVDPENDLCLVVLALGRRHGQLYRVPDSSYGPVGDALNWALDQGLGAAFDAETRGAWTHLFRILSTTMKMGARNGRLQMELGAASRGGR